MDPDIPGMAGATVRVLTEGASALDLEVESDGEPFWLVLGQSYTDGWTVDTDGGTVGDRQLVDGFANGWLVTPDGEGRFTIDLRWEPQRLVWVGGAVSGLAVLACGALLVFGRRRGAADPVPALSAAPRLVQWAGPGIPLGLGEAFGLAAIVGLGTFLVATPVVAWPGLGGGLRWPRSRRSARERSSWSARSRSLASRIGPRPSLAWLAVAVLAADLLVGARRVSRSR